MLLDGLNNENEFYSDHYLAKIFAWDIRDVLAAWQEQESAEREQAKGQGGAHYSGYRTPANHLNGLARAYLARLDELLTIYHVQFPVMRQTLPPAEGSSNGPVERQVRYKAPSSNPTENRTTAIAWEAFIQHLNNA